MSKLYKYIYKETNSELKFAVYARYKDKADSIISIENTDSPFHWEYESVEEAEIKVDPLKIEQKQKEESTRKLNYRRSRQS